MSKLEKTLIAINFIIFGFLTIFSYSYVDLNLTISQNPTFLNFVNSMQRIGYFNRPAATLIYLIFLIIAFGFFAINLSLFYKSKINLTYLKLSTVLNCIVLIFAYPFLSSDLFNYLFDAKIILKYHVSPYTHRALDFPNDDWIRFMRWIHRYSPYGPLWLVFSLVPAFLGFGKFILNLLTFKIFIGLFHLINSYLIYKTLEKINSKKALFGTAFYSLNPLFLIEGIANAHNDIVLAAFLIAPIYFLVNKKVDKAITAQICGIFIKYIPVLNLPWLIWAMIKRGDVRNLVLENIIVMAVFTYIFSSFQIRVPFVSPGATQVQFQPWYLFWTLPLVSLVPEIYLIIAAVVVGIGASLRYLPYLYFGDWSQPGTTQFMMVSILISTIIAALLIIKNIKHAKT